MSRTKPSVSASIATSSAIDSYNGAAAFNDTHDVGGLVIDKLKKKPNRGVLPRERESLTEQNHGGGRAIPLLDRAYYQVYDESGQSEEYWYLCSHLRHLSLIHVM